MSFAGPPSRSKCSTAQAGEIVSRACRRSPRAPRRALGVATAAGNDRCRSRSPGRSSRRGTCAVAWRPGSHDPGDRRCRPRQLDELLVALLDGPEPLCPRLDRLGAQPPGGSRRLLEVDAVEQDSGRLQDRKRRQRRPAVDDDIGLHLVSRRLRCGNQVHQALAVSGDKRRHVCQHGDLLRRPTERTSEARIRLQAVTIVPRPLRATAWRTGAPARSVRR